VKVALLVSLTLSWLDPSLLADDKVSVRLKWTVDRLNFNDPVLVWVFFRDKGRLETLKPDIHHSLVSERSLLRRNKVRSADALVDYTDFPIEQSYMQELTAIGVHVRQQSKWFNGVSVVATRGQLEQIQTLPFVRELELVWRAGKGAELVADVPVTSTTTFSTPIRGNSILDLNYGPSLTQVQSINVPAVHNNGNYGQGVVVGVFDNGFRLLNHEVFDSLRTRIVATYDFVDHKVSVVPNNPAQNFGAHGIVTLSTLGGYIPGELIGPAFGASFILARTENDSSETPIEEDNWVAAIEWADSIGVDVTSTSLGYLDYNQPYASWSWQDMNGNTTLITKAADMAVGKGILVVNSAGNNGLDPSHNTLNAPADGDSVLAIGATTVNGTRASFSSVGPTTSVPVRIKPDVMAQGTLVHCASPTDPIGYTYQQGTSLSCPLAAGVAALILHAKPDATPVQVANVMRMTASQANTPDNLMGWGVINAAAAVNYLTRGVQSPGSFLLADSYPNPFPTPTNPSTTIGFILAEQSEVTLKIFNTLGQEVRTVISDHRTSGAFSVAWDGTNNSGLNVASGVYFYRLVASGISGRSYTDVRKLSVIR
jgi:serine protease AprX